MWGNDRCHLTFDYDENKENMASALRTAQLLFSDQNNWDTRMKKFASCELLELANDWLDNINEEITSDMFTDRICITNISVYPGGDFTIFFEDGDLFLGHTIIVAGNIDGTFESAEIAG
ncbi:DUF2262 domain-containing protein [Metabacillus sp. 84]|uniref:DUF2262 domain-containing protein n=1 Tax=Metabacillus sp. 84 TaxID=3404705 RepID=UPI003CED6641